MGEPERRRRRLRPASYATSSTEAPADPPVTDPPLTGPPPAGPVADTSAVADPVPEGAEPAGGPALRPGRPGLGDRPRRPPGTRLAAGGGDERDAERGLRGLVGSGSSQVSVGAALRARDAARPTDAHLADAEQNLTIVRRNWLPREDLPRNR